MSETQTVPPPVYKYPGAVTVQDDKGRTLEICALDILDELDLIEAAGADLASNARWMMIATFAACVRAIDGVPSIPATNRRSIRERVKRVGPEGLRAAVKALSPEDVPEGAAAVIDTLDVAKNSAGTSDFAS